MGRKNITTIRDLMTDDGTTLIDYNTFKTKYTDTPRTNFLIFNGIRQAVKIFLREMKSKVDFTLKCSYWVWDVIRAGNYQVKKSRQHLEIGRKKSGIPKQINTRNLLFFFNLRIQNLSSMYP